MFFIGLIWACPQEVEKPDTRWKFFYFLGSGFRHSLFFISFSKKFIPEIKKELKLPIAMGRLNPSRGTVKRGSWLFCHTRERLKRKALLRTLLNVCWARRRPKEATAVIQALAKCKWSKAESPAKTINANYFDQNLPKLMLRLPTELWKV